MTGTVGKQQNLCKELISYVEKDEVAYYRKASTMNYAGWHLLVALSIILSTAASLIAALTPADSLKEAWPRGFLIALPIFGAMVTAFLKSFSFHEREQNREIGRIEIERLLRKAQSGFAGAQSEDDYRKVYLELTDDLAKLSHDQHKLDVATRRGTQQSGHG